MESTGQSNQNQSDWGVPTAIVVAGALIALAIYFGGRSNSSANQLADANQPAPTAAGPVIGDTRPVGETDHVRGPAEAPVTIIEYSDLECPFCRQFHPTMKKIRADYPDQVRWIYRHFPLDQLHRQARPEAVATECAGEQGKFWELIDLIYQVTPSNDGLDLETLPKLAQQAGVANLDQFNDCLKSGRYDQRIEDDIADAKAAGGRGTPYSLVLGPAGQKIPINGAQPYERVKEIIDRVLAAKN